MSRVSPQTVASLHALNDWLAAVYGRETRLSHLLRDAGIDSARIERLQADHLEHFIDGVLAFLRDFTTGWDGARRQQIMLRYYGLWDGPAETLQALANRYGLGRARIRKLRDARLEFMQEPANRDRFKHALATLARRLLSGEDAPP